MPPVIYFLIHFVQSLLVALATGYCLKKARRTARIFPLLVKILGPLYLVLTLLPVAGALMKDSPLRFFLMAAGNLYLGFFVYYGVLLVLLLGLRLLVLSISRGRAGKRWPGPVLLLAFGSACLIYVYGLIHAQDIQVTRYDVTIEKSAGQTRELDLVLLGDLHLSVNSCVPTIRKMVDLVNEQDPDAVLIAGDIFTSSYGGMLHHEEYASLLREMKTRYGVYAVYGNHDVEENLFGGFPIGKDEDALRTPEMEAFFDDAGFLTLADETVLLTEGVQLAGRLDGERAGDGTDHRKSPKELLSDLDKDLPIIVLAHEPWDFAALKAAGADLALCGHTHNGQMFPGNLIVPFFNENAYGYKILYGLDNVVTSGVGYYGPPMRVGTDAEIVVLHLTFAAS